MGTIDPREDLAVAGAPTDPTTSCNCQPTGPADPSPNLPTPDHMCVTRKTCLLTPTPAATPASVPPLPPLSPQTRWWLVGPPLPLHLPLQPPTPSPPRCVPLVVLGAVPAGASCQIIHAGCGQEWGYPYPYKERRYLRLETV